MWNTAFLILRSFLKEEALKDLQDNAPLASDLSAPSHTAPYCPGFTHGTKAAADVFRA
jgi:hypothetical protein